MSAEVSRADIRPGIKFPIHLRGDYERLRYLPSGTLQPLLEKAQRFELLRERGVIITNTAAVMELVLSVLSGADGKIALGGLTAVAVTNLYLWAKGARVQMIADEIASRSDEEQTSPDLV